MKFGDQLIGLLRRYYEKLRLWVKRYPKIAIPTLFILGPLFIATIMVMWPQSLTTKAPTEKFWTVSAIPVQYGDYQPDLMLFGEIVAGRDIELRSLVAGQVIATGSAFREGGRVGLGELLVEIDPFEYQAALDEGRAQLNEAIARLAEYTGFTLIANASGQPGISLPLHWNDDNLPIGVQLLGRYGDEATLIRMAAQLEEARPWSERRPPVSA